MIVLNQESPPALPIETPALTERESATPPQQNQEERPCVNVRSLQGTGLNEQAKITVAVGGLAALLFFSIGMIPLAIAAITFTTLTCYQAWGKRDWRFDADALTSGVLLLMAGLTKRFLPVLAATALSAINPLIKHFKGAGLWIILIVILMLQQLRQKS